MTAKEKKKTTHEMITEKEIWAGLNRPELDVNDIDIAVLGIPYDGGVSFRNGAKDAPNELRAITYTIPPTTEHFESLSGLKIKDFGDINSEEREYAFDAAETIVSEFVKKKGKFFTMIGGDHSTTIPVLKGIDKAVSEPFGIIHIDAHFDLCDALGDDKLSHGSVERRALELDNVPDSESIFFYWNTVCRGR